MKSLKKWFKGFHASAAKTHLKMSVSRSKSAQAKCQAQIKGLEREVAVYLKDHREDKARIKAEQLNQAMNMDKAYDLLAVWLELVATRIKFIEKMDECPEDMISTIASIIYCQGRCEVPELDQVREQFEYKYGDEWIRLCHTNEVKQVHPKLVMCLGIQPPRRWEITQILVDVAQKFRLEWQAPEEDMDGPNYAPGTYMVPPVDVNLAHVPQEARRQPSPRAQKDQLTVTVPANYQPGTQTVNIQLHGGREILVNVPPNTRPGEQISIPISAVGKSDAGTLSAAAICTGVPLTNPPSAVQYNQQASPRPVIVADPAPRAPVRQPSLAPPEPPKSNPSSEDKWSDLFGWLLRENGDERAKTDACLRSADYIAIFFFSLGNAASERRIPVIQNALRKLKELKCEVIGVNTGKCRNSDFSHLQFRTMLADEPKRAELWDENKDMVQVGDIVLLDKEREVVTPMAGSNLEQDPECRHFPWLDGLPDDAAVPASAPSAALNGEGDDEYDDLLSRFAKLKD